VKRVLDEKLFEQTRMIGHLQSSLNDKESDIAQLQHVMTQALRRLERKKAQIAEKRVQVQRLAADLLAAQRAESEQRARAAQSEVLEGAGQKLEARFHETQTRLRREEESGARTANELLQMQSELHRVLTELETANGRCAQYSTKVAALTEQNKTLRTEVERRDIQETLAAVRAETIAALAADANAHAKENAELKQFVLTLQAQIDTAHLSTAEILTNTAASGDEDVEEWLKVKDVMEKIAQACVTTLEEN
jgi:chromosome segregation ATPase